MSTFGKLFGVALVVFLLTLLAAMPAFAETETVCVAGVDGIDCPEPIQVPCGVADVDGVIGEWAEADFIADMYRAGDPTKKVESKLYLRYDAQTDTLYVMVKVVDGVTVVLSPTDAFVKVAELGPGVQVDGNSGDNGTPPDFQWTSGGYEASLTLAEGVWTLNVHLQVNDGGSQTSAVAHRALRVKLGPCEVPDPASITIEKTVENNDSGTLDADDFVFYINGKPAVAGVKYEVPAGNYTLVEEPKEGYTAGPWGGDCKPDGTITLVAGKSAICTITNDDVEDEGTIRVKKFNDKNGDGIPQPEEVMLEGWTFQLKTPDGQTVLQEKSTDANGTLTFVALFGKYLVCEVTQPDWDLTTEPPCQLVEVTDKVGSIDIWFGNRYTKGDAIVIKFYDKNKSGGEPEQGEPVLPGFEIILYQNLVEVGRATTDAEGKVVFEDIPEGDYTACEVLPEGWLPVNLCVDLTVVGGEAVTGFIRNYKEPTAEDVESQPGRPQGFQILLPSLNRN